MRIKRRDSLFIRRGRRIWFYDIVQGQAATTVMTTTLRRRRTGRGNLRQYWSHAADSSQDLSLRLANPMQSRSLMYPSLSHRRLPLRRSTSVRPRQRKPATAAPTRFPNDVLAAYKASCMRKTRRPSPLNVGELQITSTHIHFTAHYLNSAPLDAQVSLPFDGIVHIRRACYRRVLPHGVLVRCEGFPDYLMVLADRRQQSDVLQVLSNALRNAQNLRHDMKPRLPSTSDRLFAYDSSSSIDRDVSSEHEPSVEGHASKELEEDLSRNAVEQTEPKEANQASAVEEPCVCRSKSNTPLSTPDKSSLQSSKTVTFAATTVSQGKRLFSSGPEQFMTLANDLIQKDDGNVDEQLMESIILLVFAALLLFVVLGVIVAISSLRSRVVALTSLIGS